MRFSFRRIHRLLCLAGDSRALLRGKPVGWVPQIRVEHKVALAENSNLLFQGGILDPVSGEAPRLTDLLPRRRAPANHRANRPTVRASRGPRIFSDNRCGWARADTTVGRITAFNRNVDGWAGMADFDLPLNQSVFVERKVLSRKSSRRPLRRNRTQCVVQRRSDSARHRNASVGFSRAAGRN